MKTECLEIRKEKEWPFKCDICSNVSNYTLVFKNKDTKNNKKILLCDEHYKDILNNLKNYN